MQAEGPRGAPPDPAPAVAGSGLATDVLWVHAGPLGPEAAGALTPFGLTLLPAAGEGPALRALEARAGLVAGVVIGHDLPRLARARLLDALRRRWPRLAVSALATGDARREAEGLAASLRAVGPDPTGGAPAALGEALRHYARRLRLSLLGYGSGGLGPREVLGAYLREARARVRQGTLSAPADPARARAVRAWALGGDDGSPAAILPEVLRDPVLAGRLVALANSTAYGGRSRVAHPAAALVRVGAAGVASLVGPEDLDDPDLPDDAISAIRQERARCARVSRVARAIADDAGPEGAAELAAFSGLVLRVGRLVARAVLLPDRVPAEARAEVLDAEGRSRHADAAEQAFTFALVSRWQLGGGYDRLLLAHRDPAARVPLSPAGACAVRADLLVQIREAGLHESLDDLPPPVQARVDGSGLGKVPREHLERWLALAGDAAEEGAGAPRSPAGTWTR
ncbi:HDOD domain-containing protein [Myxococcota bacterium]|nr:HDOD domain-containing protein [Myxococcota bacterium]